MFTKEDVLRYLAILEDQIDEVEEERLLNEWLAFTRGSFTGSIFTPHRSAPRPPKEPFPVISINQALADYNAMAIRQFSLCSQALETASGNVLSVRCDYGTSIIMSLFDVKIYYMEEALNTLPTSFPMSGGLDEAKRWMQSGITDFNKGFYRNTFEMGEYFAELLNAFPKIKKYVFLYHPDFQGPFDITEVLLGSDIFYDLVDNPDDMKDFIGFITDLYILSMNRWRTIAPYNGEYSAHWGMLMRGELMLRDDSAMNLSPAMVEEFINPYDRKLLNTFGGGCIHFCGRGDHYIDKMTANNPNLYAINTSQPHLNDMDTMLRCTIDRDIRLIGLNGDAARFLLEQGKDFRHLVNATSDEKSVFTHADENGSR